MIEENRSLCVTFSFFISRNLKSLRQTNARIQVFIGSVSYKGLFHQKTLLLTKTEFEWLACFQVQSYRLNHWGEKFCFLDGRSRTAIKTNKYQGTLKRKRSAPRMGSYIPRCKISLASFSLCQVKKRFRFCFPLAWKLSIALFRLLSLPRPWPPLTQAQMSPRDLSRAIAIVAISQFSLQNFCSGAINS